MMACARSRGIAKSPFYHLEWDVCLQITQAECFAHFQDFAASLKTEKGAHIFIFVKMMKCIGCTYWRCA
jgi:hypothetical protein